MRRNSGYLLMGLGMFVLFAGYVIALITPMSPWTAAVFALVGIGLSHVGLWRSTT